MVLVRLCVNMYWNLVLLLLMLSKGRLVDGLEYIVKMRSGEHRPTSTI